MKTTTSKHLMTRFRLAALYTLLACVIAACSATAQQVIPTELPTQTATYTPSPTNTPARNVTPTRPPTREPNDPDSPSPTPLLGPTRTALPNAPTPTNRPFNPNAPRIEFFTSDVLSIEPGGEVTLFWSARGIDSAVIYRLDREGTRSQVWNVGPDGSLPVRTRSSDRGDLNFVLGVGEEELYSELGLTIPIRCPIEWFFIPAPEDCPAEEAEQTRITEQPFERGRMLYVENDNLVYVLFNDGQEPAWLVFDNRYDPEVHAESEANFVPPPGFFQPLRELGLLWRGNDTVRNRLGLGVQEVTDFLGFQQTATLSGERENLYVSSADNTVIHIVPGGDVWELIAP